MAVTDQILAAGGVVWRQAPEGELEVLLVHRPRHDDWSFPKGKVEVGEADEACAVREVEEETNLRCALGVELPSVSYRDRKGRDKTVRYWAMEATGIAVARNEVDLVRWVSPDVAASLLSYAADRALLAAFVASLPRPTV